MSGNLLERFVQKTRTKFCFKCSHNYSELGAGANCIKAVKKYIATYLALSTRAMVYTIHNKHYCFKIE